MALYVTRTPTKVAGYVSKDILTQQRTPTAVSNSAAVGVFKPVRMRGRSGSTVVFWDSLNGRPDTTGLYYPAACSAIIAFASLTEVLVVP